MKNPRKKKVKMSQRCCYSWVVCLNAAVFFRLRRRKMSFILLTSSKFFSLSPPQKKSKQKNPPWWYCLNQCSSFSSLKILWSWSWKWCVRIKKINIQPHGYLSWYNLLHISASPALKKKNNNNKCSSVTSHSIEWWDLKERNVLAFFLVCIQHKGRMYLTKKF